jgi:hypothetical protein
MIEGGDQIRPLTESAFRRFIACTKLERYVVPSPKLLDDVGPVVLPDCPELNLDRVAVPSNYQVERPVTALLRRGNVVTLAMIVHDFSKRRRTT